jgi:hypothetical protein
MSYAVLTGSGVTPNNTVTLRAGANATIAIYLRDANNKPFVNYIANYTSIIVADTERGRTISMDKWLVGEVDAAEFFAWLASHEAAGSTAMRMLACTCWCCCCCAGRQGLRQPYVSADHHRGAQWPWHGADDNQRQQPLGIQAGGGLPAEQREQPAGGSGIGGAFAAAPAAVGAHPIRLLAGGSL